MLELEKWEYYELCGKSESQDVWECKHVMGAIDIQATRSSLTHYLQYAMMSDRDNLGFLKIQELYCVYLQCIVYV